MFEMHASAFRISRKLFIGVASFIDFKNNKIGAARTRTHWRWRSFYSKNFCFIFLFVPKKLSTLFHFLQLFQIALFRFVPPKILVRFSFLHAKNLVHFLFLAMPRGLHFSFFANYFLVRKTKTVHVLTQSVLQTCKFVCPFATTKAVAFFDGCVKKSFSFKP